jgi:hypothetical protein
MEPLCADFEPKAQITVTVSFGATVNVPVCPWNSTGSLGASIVLELFPCFYSAPVQRFSNPFGLYLLFRRDPFQGGGEGTLAAAIGVHSNERAGCYPRQVRRRQLPRPTREATGRQ